MFGLCVRSVHLMRFVYVGLFFAFLFSGDAWRVVLLCLFSAIGCFGVAFMVLCC